jgi:hypothetical protein
MTFQPFREKLGRDVAKAGRKPSDEDSFSQGQLLRFFQGKLLRQLKSFIDQCGGTAYNGSSAIRYGSSQLWIRYQT